VSRFVKINKDMIVKWMDCFASQEEFLRFHATILDLSDGLQILQKEIINNSLDTSTVFSKAMNQFFILCVFYRDHIELIHQLMKELDYEEASTKDLEDFNKETSI
jgi:hypothetical protein